MRCKLALMVAAASLATLGLASAKAAMPAQNNAFYVSIGAGMAHTTQPSASLYSSDTPLKTGYNLTGAAGYVFALSKVSDLRAELQYLHTYNGYSDNLKKFMANLPSPKDALTGNYVMANAIYDYSLVPQFKLSVGFGLGYAHLSALADNLDLSGASNVTRDFFGADNTYAMGAILGGQYSITPDVAVGVNYEALMTSTPRAGELVSYNEDDGSVNVSNAFLINNLVNVSLTYKLPA